VHPLDPLQGVRLKRGVDLHPGQPVLHGPGGRRADGNPSSSWYRACLLWLMIHWNPTSGVGLRHAMGVKYESCSVIGHRIRRDAYGAGYPRPVQVAEKPDSGAGWSPFKQLVVEAKLLPFSLLVEGRLPTWRWDR
jgi:hypothetical protein